MMWALAGVAVFMFVCWYLAPANDMTPPDDDSGDPSDYGADGP